MPEWGFDRQKLLKSAKVAVIGAGGVKSTLLMALGASGVGNIKIYDFDRVELSNLNRQTLYRTEDIGKYKSIQAKKLISELNPDIYVESSLERIDSKNIHQELDSFDFIVEGGESPSGRNLVNEYCLNSKKPFVHASAQFNYGYVFTVDPKIKSACFACFFPNDHMREIHTGAVPVSVLSVQIAGTLGANEVLKWFLGYKDKLFVNKRMYFSSLFLSQDFGVEYLIRKENCPVCQNYYND